MIWREERSDERKSKLGAAPERPYVAFDLVVGKPRVCGPEPLFDFCVERRKSAVNQRPDAHRFHRQPRCHPVRTEAVTIRCLKDLLSLFRIEPGIRIERPADSGRCHIQLRCERVYRDFLSHILPPNTFFFYCTMSFPNKQASELDL